MGRGKAVQPGAHLMSTPPWCVMATPRSMLRSFDPVSPGGTSMEPGRVWHTFHAGSDSFHHRSVVSAGGSALAQHEHAGGHQQQAGQQ